VKRRATPGARGPGGWAVPAPSFFLTAALLAACSSSSPSPSSPGGDDGDDANQGGATASGDASATSDAALLPVVKTAYDVARTYAGEYAAQIHFRKLESVGTLGSENALVTLDATVTITDDAATQAVTFSMQMCHVELSGQGTGLLAGSGVVTPDIVMTTTKLDPVPFSAANENGTVHWSVPEVHGPIGWKWTSPSDLLPTSASDPRVFDQDGDMNPGVTIEVTLAGTATPVYVVQTERDTFSGTADSAGDLTASVADDTVQNVLGSTNPLLASAALTSQPDSSSTDDVAHFVHVPSHLACADLLAQIATLFPAGAEAGADQ
jgi:hypothetical protein